MSGLSETERAGCIKILNLMSKVDLLSLSDTVTNKLIVVENAKGMFLVCITERVSYDTHRFPSDLTNKTYITQVLYYIK